jgi:hypothetical protein
MLKIRDGSPCEREGFMTINYPATRVSGFQSGLRFVGVQKGTAVLGASPSIRITGVGIPAEIVVVHQEISQTIQIGVEGTNSLTERASDPLFDLSTH